VAISFPVISSERSGGLMAKSKGDTLLMISKGVEIGGRVDGSHTMEGQHR